MSVVVTIYRGDTFLMTDAWGEISREAIHGFFRQGIRFLSRYEMLINGEGTFLLTSRAVDPAFAVHYLSNIVDGLPRAGLQIILKRRVGPGLMDRLTVRNYSPEAEEFDLDINLDADFEDMYRVKSFLWQTKLEAQSPLSVDREARRGEGRLSWDYRPGNGGTPCRTKVRFDRPFEPTPSGIQFHLHLDPREEWTTSMVLEAEAGPRGEGTPPGQAAPAEDSGPAGMGSPRPAAVSLRTDWDPLGHAFDGAIQGLGFLEEAAADAAAEPHLLAAGIPWFIYLFGRDSLITSYQALPFFPEIATASLRALARYQASSEDPGRDMEQGKIPHQVPFGRDLQRQMFRFPYYGSVDVTPLFLILLSEAWRWTGDDGLVRDLRGNALRALGWIHASDGDGEGYLEYAKRAERGLVSQGWKDSAGSVVFSDGREAQPPIALVEVQAYAYDAKLRTAELAEEVWHDLALAQQLEGEARDLRDRFNRDFWIDRRGGMYALALDADRRPVDAFASNFAHALWCGIVPRERAPRCAELLLTPELFSGWGVRTLAVDEAAYHPVGYHRGTVWPWDTSIAAMGLARYGLGDPALRLIRGLVEVAPYFGNMLPELFAGYARTEQGSPVDYPTACQPQAWSEGAVLLALRILLGLEPQRRKGVVTLDPKLPQDVGRVEVKGVSAFGGRFSVRATGGEASVVPA